MDIAEIVKALKLERDRIDEAIAALNRVSAGKAPGRRRTKAGQGRTAAAQPERPRMSAAGRKRISDAAKARWAKIKRAGRTSPG